MNSFQFIIAGALIANITMGILVFFTNWRRPPNRFFLFLSLVVAAWFFCLGGGSTASTNAGVESWIRLSSAAAALLPVAVNLLLLSIASGRARTLEIFVRARWWMLAYAGVAILFRTRFFLESASLPTPGHIVAVPHYGPGFGLFVVYLVASFLVLTLKFLRTTRRLSGMVRTELQFMLLGTATGLATGIAILLTHLFTGNSDAIQVLPLSAVAMDGILAYGIATHRVMDVPTVLRRMTAYTLLAVYLVLLYIGVDFGAFWLLGHVIRSPASFARILATIAVAVSLVPANGLLQRVANRLFVNVQDVDVTETIQKANRVLTSLGTLDSLLKGFCEVVARAMGTDRVLVLLEEGRTFRQRYPLPDGADRGSFPADSVVIQTLDRHRAPLVPDLVQRVRRDPEVIAAAKQLQTRKFAVAVGIYSKGRMDGILLLGPRLSGRIYGAAEQELLQLLCRQLAVSLENAKLYTQLQDGNIYNEILLDNLVSGVAAASADGRITVFNREAQRITRLNAGDVIDKPLNVLPAPLAQAMQLTMERQVGLRDQEMLLLHGPNDETPVRAGSSIFRGHEGRVLGALLVFHDITVMRKLEMQVRRTDRLASIGTLAAGMAHEIKNPLVTIKTFTQLLPERYEDADFRETFSSLIGQEVKRIDSIVNQLLRFSRPARPRLTPSHLHEVLDYSLTLVSQQLRQKGIRLERSYACLHDVAQADADQLNQAFVNFLLNAIEAMEPGGCLTVTTEQVQTGIYPAIPWEDRGRAGQIRIVIQDTGAGIRPEDLARIFDPFFTTKSHGTGLGLSVAHGIIQEHGGVIDVESDPKKGTAFAVFLPLLTKEAAV